MTFLQEFSYSNIIQRRLIYFNAFFSSLAVGFILTDLAASIKYYAIYEPVLQRLILIFAGALFLGNITGRFLLKGKRSFRAVYIASDFVAASTALLLILRAWVFPADTDPLISMYSYSRFFPAAVLFITFFCLGIKANYFLKVSSGNFIDDRQPLSGFLFLTAAGFSIGLLTGAGQYLPQFLDASSSIRIAAAISAFTVLVSIPFIKLSYNPQIMIAHRYEDTLPSLEEKEKANDSILFIYLGIALIVIYSFLTFSVFMKSFGKIFYTKTLFTVIAIIASAIGFFIGKIPRLRFSHVLSLLAIPPLFLVYKHTLLLLGEKISVFHGLLFIAPLFMFFGYILSQITRVVISRFKHNKRYEILDIAFLIMPFPLGAALSFLELTNLMFALLLYGIICINIILPGLYSFSGKVHRFRKAGFVIYAMLLIPSAVFSHIYLSLSTENTPFIIRAENFQDLQSTNFNARYISNRSLIKIDGIPAFKLSDSTVKNMVRSYIPILMLNEDSQEKVLIVDGNGSFLRNPAIPLFKSSYCIQPLAPAFTDFRSLPISGERFYACENHDAFFYLLNNRTRYRTIIESPNLLDQSINQFKFSRNYLSLVKSRIKKDGIFALTLNTLFVRKGFLDSAVKSLSQLFTHHAVYVFSDTILILCSDSQDSLAVTPDRLNYLNQIINSDDFFKTLFFHPNHMLSHFWSSKLETISDGTENVGQRIYISEPSDNKLLFSETQLNNYFTANSVFLETISREDYYSLQYLQRDIASYSDMYSTVKRAEYSEAAEDYEAETSLLFDLKKYSSYRADLRLYLDSLLKSKEQYYYETAVELERSRNWESAKTIYKAILKINPDNFDANYRLGILSLTLQELDNSFLYLQKAMKLKNNHPKVLFQMGVLFFSMGETEKSVDYLNQAIQANERSAALYLYLGMAYEKLGRTYEAISCYEKAAIEDPNDANIRERLLSITGRKDGALIPDKPQSPKNQMEEEQGEVIPLPINKSAYDIRLGDSAAE